MKALAERILLHAGPAAVSRRSHRKRGLVLAYHNIVPDGESLVGDESLHLPCRRFVEQLDVLSDEAIRVVSLDELTGVTGEPEVVEPRRRVAITFDDAYRGAMQAGVKELVRRDLPATVFVVPGLLGDRTFWWDALSATDAGLIDGARTEALEVARGRNEEVIAWARRSGLPLGEVPEHARSATEAELRSATLHDGIEIASHTWSHANLARLTEEECRVDIARAAEWLQQRFEEDPRWLSYPYGLHS
ncbi:MAG: polysaccharide deacetylase family protein, partial [Gemmatimonadota bacterium]